MRKLNPSLLLSALVISILSLVASSAMAQQKTPKYLDGAQPLRLNYVFPAVRPDDGFTITRPNDLGHLGFSVNGIMNYGFRPQNAGVPDGRPVITNYLAANIGLSFGLFERFSIDALIPVNLLITGGDDAAKLKSADTNYNGKTVFQNAQLPKPLGKPSLGDIQAGVRGRLYGSNDDPFSVGMYAGVFIPTANLLSGIVSGGKNAYGDDCSPNGPNYCQYYQGNKDFGVRATALLEYRPLDRLNLDANVGVTWAGAPQTIQRRLKFNDPLQVNLSLGGSYALLEDKNLVVYGEVLGSLMGFDFNGVSGKFDAESLLYHLPAAALGGVKYKTDFGLTAGLAAGAAITKGYGGASPRILLNVGWTMQGDPDTDGDGIKDSMDKCPNDPEDFDGFEDQDGCPDLDNDNDGIPDSVDKCPNEAEDIDGFEDQDGCPDPDNDKDGIPDAEDKCPNEAGIPEKQGCPVRDADGDGIEDDVDKCPSEPEDKDGFQDQDGCPDPDNDGDGILDADDKCPNEAGPASNHGCPIKDRDGDGIPDDVDKCPDQPETYNGVKDDDGCPDGKAKVVVTKTQVQINETIYFASGKSQIKSKSYKLLDTVAEVLNKYDQITKLRIAGYTDNVGDPNANLELSKERAKAVLDYLVKKGVAADRLTSEGYGENDPICKDIPELTKTKKDARKNRRKIKECQAANRRVEFQVTELNHRPVDASSQVTVVEKKEETTEPAPAPAPAPKKK